MRRSLATSAEPRRLTFLDRKINREVGRAIREWNLIQPGDRILAAVSGGKDSYTMLHYLLKFQKKAPIEFEVVAMNLDQGQPGFPKETLPHLFEEWGATYHIETQDTYSIVLDKLDPGATMCSLCSRLRRGVLYRVARELKCNKLALGHHRDDLLQTFLLNAFFSGKLGAMPPMYRTKDGDIDVIRPLYSVPEHWIKEFVDMQAWPIIPCNLCGSQEGMRRQQMASLLEDLRASNPNVKNSLFGAMGNIHKNEMLDRSIWDDSRISLRH